MIPTNEGLSVKLEGNIFTDVGSPHYNAYKAMEAFWDMYRPGGVHAGEIPTVEEYNVALQGSLRAAGVNSQNTSALVSQAAQQQQTFGLTGESLVPHIPGRINLQ